ncbi:MAG: hypothetical protein GF330_05030 [Candidatus Eisenbacteria bacterium]|nr:hypothetical protein [Candidatus Eisenbacteria bacterium]
MSFLEKIPRLDRRVLYLLVAIAAVVPMFTPLGLPIPTSREVEGLFDYIEELGPGSTVLVAFDFDPQTVGENGPQASGVLRHCFERDVNVLITALSQNAPGMAQEMIETAAAEYDKVNGVDFCYLGYQPYPAIVIMSIGQNFRIPFPQDFYGTPLDSIPLMRAKQNYDDIDLVVSVAAGWVAESWVTYAKERYGCDVALAVTAVQAAQYYTFWNAQQIVGLLPGLKGAAEYQAMMKGAGMSYTDAPLRGMDVQSIEHLLIIAFIVVGNVGFFAERARQRREAAAARAERRGER